MATIQVALVAYTIFTVVVKTAVTADTSTPKPFHQGPQYTINCLATGNVEVKGVSSLTNLTVVGTNTCSTGTTFAENKGKIVIPKQCLSDQDVMNDRSVTFTIHDSTFDGKDEVTPSTVQGLKGGQSLHKITVHCKSLPENGMNVYVVHGVGLATPQPNIPTEIEKVEMRLKSEKYVSYKDVTDLPDVSTVYIGDKFYMYLVYLGVDKYSVIPTDCKAVEGAYASEPSSSVKKLELYTNNSCISSEAKAYRVMHPFRVLKNDEPRIVSAEMYGFMFNSEKEITFVCTVNICNGGSACVLPTCSADGDWSSGRRRRSSATQDKQQFTITKRLRVQRKTVPNSSGFIKSSFVCMILLLLFTRM